MSDKTAAQLRDEARGLARVWRMNRGVSQGETYETSMYNEWLQITAAWHQQTPRKYLGDALEALNVVAGHMVSPSVDFEVKAVIRRAGLALMAALTTEDASITSVRPLRQLQEMLIETKLMPDAPGQLAARQTPGIGEPN